MRIKDIICEASGLKSARPGEVYTSERDGTEYKFFKWEWQFPPAEDRYEDQNVMLADIEQYTNGDPNKIAWVNPNSSARSRSFAVAQFRSDSGQDLWVGKFFQAKNINNTISDSEARVAAGIFAGTKDKKSSSAVKTEAQLKPKPLGLATNMPMYPSQIQYIVQHANNGGMLAKAVTEATTGKPIVFTGGKPIQPALQDDFCEVIAPIAMLANHPVVDGDYARATTDIFKGESLKGAQILFPAGSNNTLIDSYIVAKSGVTMAVSSKGGAKGGASATVTAIYKAKEEAKRTSTGRAYIEQFKEAADFLDLVQNNTMEKLPIVAAQKYNLATPAELAGVEKLLNSPKNTWAQVTGDVAHDLSLVPGPLKKLFQEVGYRPGSFIPYLCIGAVARRVARFVNDPNNPMQFGEAVRSFLNSSAMVQANAIVQSAGKDDAQVKTINITYPPNFKSQAVIDPNSYAGTTIVTKLKIKMPKD
jgi:hypothetical protein